MSNEQKEPGPDQIVCPACGALAEAEHVHNGVGLVQVEPFHCFKCQWFEGGKMDELLYKIKQLESWREIAIDGLPDEEIFEVLVKVDEPFFGLTEPKAIVAYYAHDEQKWMNDLTDREVYHVTHWKQIDLP